MQGDEDCSLSHTKGSGSLDLERHSKMFRPSCRSSSPFSHTDLNMWDTKSRFTSQTSAWCGMATVSGSGFLSKVSTSTSGSTGSFRQNDSGLKKWQSLSHLASEGPTGSFPPSPGVEARAARGESSFKQAETVQWLQDAHERIDTQLGRLRARDYNMNTSQLLEMKHRQQLEALELEKGAAELSLFDKTHQRRELHEKVLKLEKDLLQMRSSLAQTPESRSLPVSQEDVNRQEKQKVDTELCKLREALKEAETRAKTQEEERNQALQQLQTSTETQRTMSSQIEEMKQRLSNAASNHSEVQEQLSEANNKISQACLEKAILSTQVLKLEDNVKELKSKLTEALTDKDHLIQEKADLHQKAQILEQHLDRVQPGSEDQESFLMKEVNETLTCELEAIRQKLEMSQSQLQEVTAQRVNNTQQIRDLEAERSELIRQKEELLNKMKEGGHEMKEKCSILQESVEALELEKNKLQDRCLCLEAEVLETEEKLNLLEEEYRKQDSARVRKIKELKAVASHWTEKWQNVALSLQSKQEELDTLKKNNFRNERESDSLDSLRIQLDACKQELELERSRNQALIHRHKDEGKGGDAVQTQDRDGEMETDLSQSSLLCELPPESHSSQNKSDQVFVKSSEIQRLKEKLTERENELREKDDALNNLEKLRETEQTESQMKVSALELELVKKVSGEGRDGDSQANVSIIDSLRTKLEESRRRENQLQQEKLLAVQKLQTLQQLYQVKDEKPAIEEKNDKTVAVNLETVQQRKMVTEQLKNLFKEREEKEEGKIDDKSTAAQTGSASSQDWTPTPKAARNPMDRWSWQQSSSLMPVFEEDEEECEGEEEEGESTEEAHAEMSATSAEKTKRDKNENLLEVLRLEQPTQALQTAAEEEEMPTLQRTTSSLFPDGIFLAELIEICSPDEDEEEGEDK